MRTIKFRGKDEKGNWHYGDLENSPIGKFYRIHEYKDNGYYKGVVDVDPETIGQFTGLAGKNGKPIYEGDIVRHDENGKCYSIIYEEPMFRFAPNDDFFAFLNHPELLEVVGNIHDLIEKGGKK